MATAFEEAGGNTGKPFEEHRLVDEFPKNWASQENLQQSGDVELTFGDQYPDDN